MLIAFHHVVFGLIELQEDFPHSLHTTMSSLKPYIILITLIATLGGLLFGYDTAVISGTVGSLRVVFIDPQHLGADAANSLLGFVVSSALIGCIIGGIIGGWVSTNIGRKRGLIIAAFLFLLSALGSAAPEFLFAPIGTGGAAYIWHLVFLSYRWRRRCRPRLHAFAHVHRRNRPGQDSRKSRGVEPDGHRDRHAAGLFRQLRHRRSRRWQQRCVA